MPPKRQKSTMSFRIHAACTLVLLMLTACAPVDALNALVPDDGYRLKRDIAYGKEFRQKLDVYLPDKPESYKSVVVFFYGGSWKGGKKEDYRFVAQSLAAQGFYVVVPNYRVYPAAKYPTFLEDCALAVAWTRDNIRRFGANRDRLFLMGHSAGAYNAMMLAIDNRWLVAAGGEMNWLKGAVGIAGPYDFLPIEDKTIQKIFSTALYPKTTQPITHVSGDEPPVLLITGMEDDQVDPKNTIRLAEKLHANERDVKVITYTDLGHKGVILELATPLKTNSQMLQDIRYFIRTH